MEKTYRDQVIELLERERTRLARDIHDGPAQTLTNTSMRIEVIKRLLEANRVQDAVAELERLQGLLRISVNDVRRMIFDLRPTFLERGVYDAFVLYAERYEQTFGIPVEIAGDWNAVSLHHSTEVALFRVYQELLSNVHKHAKATRVEVELYHRDGICGFSVRDDGHGFDTSLDHHGSFGFRGMMERVALVNGTLYVESSPGVGTRVTCEVPCKHE